MSYAVVKDNDRLEIRASLLTQEEIDQFIEQINIARKNVPPGITTVTFSGAGYDSTKEKTDE